MTASCNAELVLTIDAGGSSVKAGVVAARAGTVRGTAQREYQSSHPRPGWGEFDTVAWWKSITDACAEAVDRTGAPPGDYRAITCTAMRGPFVLVDRAGVPLYPGVLALDDRGTPFLDVLREEVDRDALYTLTGHWPVAALGLPKLLWFERTRPDVWSQVSHVLQMHDWILFALCGEMTSEPTSAGLGQLLDVAHRRWATDLLRDLRISPDLFPPLRDAGTPLGGLHPAVAREIGLLAGTPVHVGGGDTHMCCLGIDAMQPGDVAIVAGSTCPISLATTKPLLDPRSRPWVSPHLWPGLWAAEMNVGVSGLAYTWLRDICFAFAPGASRDFAMLDAEAASAPLGSHDLLVTISSAHWSEDAWRNPPPPTVFGLTTHHTLGDVARATLECVCYAIHGNLRELETAQGTTITHVTATGGATRSAFWAQMLADVLGCQIEVPYAHEAGIVAGARLIAGTTTDRAEAPVSRVVYEPNPARHAEYLPHVDRYRFVREKLSQSFR
jgi:sugar (pentulose or hexulose) kinase